MYRLATEINRKHKVFPVKGSLSEINTGNPIFYVKHHMDGHKEAIYHVNIIDQLDRVFVFDAPKFLSLEQQRFIERFIKQAGVATDKLNAGSNTPYEDMDDVFKQLDDFLGSYLGVDDGRYTR